jgi:HAMP domain-containing protein
MHRVMAQNGKTRCSAFLPIVPVMFFSLAMTTASYSGESDKEIRKKIDAIGKRIDSVAYLRDQRIKDSVQIVAKKERDQRQMSRDIGRIEELVRQCDTAISIATREKAGDEAVSRQKIEELKQNIQTMVQQKKANDDRKILVEKEANAAVAKRNRILQSSQAAENRYERLRTPYEQAVKDAEADMQQIKEEHKLLLALRDKLRMNREVAYARDSLDKAIQLQAKRKKGSKKLVERWESVLDSLNSRQDALKQKFPTLSHRENMLPGVTLAQKIMAADTAVARVERKLPAATAPYEEARKKLLAYEKTAPPPKQPSSDRLDGLDSAIAEQKKELFRLADISDSLGMKIEEARNAVSALTTPSQYGKEGEDAQLSAKRKERAALAEKRMQLVEDSLRLGSKNESTAQRITGEIAIFNNQIATLQKERDRLQESLAEKNIAERAAAERAAAERAAAERAAAERAAAERAVAEKSVAESPVADKPVTESIVTDRPVAERSVSERSSAKKPERQGFLSGLFQGRDYYSERVSGSSTESFSEDDIQLFQERQKLAALMKARDNAMRDIAYAEQLIMDKRREIELQEKMIQEKQMELERMTKAEKKYRRKDIASSPRVMNRRSIEVAQKKLEDIYTLLSDNNLSKAVQRFRQLRPFLKSNLDPEAYSTLVITMEQMGAVLQ